MIYIILLLPAGARFWQGPGVGAYAEACWWLRGDLSYIPGRQVLVEGGGIIEHMRHIDDISGIPIADRLVEG